MIWINDIPSLRDPESITYNFDDRIQRVPLLYGNTVQDYGYIPTGDYFTITCVFSMQNWLKLQQYWVNRTLVNFTDTGGTVWEKCRIVCRSYQRVAKFPNYITLNFELWRC